MGSLPWTAHIGERGARARNRGAPPTARKALTGEFTPPGRTRLARSKSERLVVESVSGLVAVIGPACGWRCQDLAPVRSLRQLSDGRLPRGAPARTRAGARPRSRAETGGRRLKTWGSCQFPCGLLGEVGQDDIGAGALDREEDLHRRPIAVEPAVLGRGPDHRVLARDVVGGDRDAEALLDAVDDVEERERGLHHDDVGSLLEIGRDLPKRLVRIPRVHLIAPP